MKDYSHNRKFFGRLGDDRIFRKVVNSRKHKMKLLDGYGIEEFVVGDLLDNKCREIRIKEEDTGTILSVPMEDFMKHSVVRNYQTEQRFLSVKYFKQK